MVWNAQRCRPVRASNARISPGAAGRSSLVMLPRIDHIAQAVRARVLLDVAAEVDDAAVLDFKAAQRHELGDAAHQAPVRRAHGAPRIAGMLARINRVRVDAVQLGGPCRQSREQKDNGKAAHS